MSLLYSHKPTLGDLGEMAEFVVSYQNLQNAHFLKDLFVMLTIIYSTASSFMFLSIILDMYFTI